MDKKRDKVGMLLFRNKLWVRKQIGAETTSRSVRWLSGKRAYCRGLTARVLSLELMERGDSRKVSSDHHVYVMVLVYLLYSHHTHTMNTKLF